MVKVEWTAARSETAFDAARYDKAYPEGVERSSVRGALLLDVLEHVDEPVEFLERLRAG
jgi:hypothetical protein